MIRKYQYEGYFLGGVTAKDLDEGTKKVAREFNQLMQSIVGSGNPNTERLFHKKIKIRYSY